VPINGSFMKYEGKPCDCDKELVNITLTGCVKEMCREKDCPKEPPPKDKCHTVVPQKEPCKCATYLQTPFHVSSPIKSTCGNDFCSKFEEVDDECKETCVEYEVEGECDENCYERKEIRNKATCTKQVTCEDLGPDKIAIKTDTCVFGLSTGRYHGNCGVCDEDSYAKLVSHRLCGHYYEHYCEKCDPKDPSCNKKWCKERVKTNDCKSYEEATPCPDDLMSRCPEECEKSLSCRCPDPVKDCPAGTQVGYVNCRLTYEECQKDPECCNQLCSTEINGRRMEKECVEESCEVCSNEYGVEIIEHHTWRNEHFCNSDERCCKRCEDASKVEKCPSDWTQEKKTKCKCKA